MRCLGPILLAFLWLACGCSRLTADEAYGIWMGTNREGERISLTFIAPDRVEFENIARKTKKVGRWTIAEGKVVVDGVFGAPERLELKEDTLSSRTVNVTKL